MLADTFADLLAILHSLTLAEARTLLLTWLETEGSGLGPLPTPYPREPYGRIPQHRDQNGEVILIHWRPQVYCAPHDHGDSYGYVLLARGKFVERLWRHTARGLRYLRTQIHQAPAVITVPAYSIHDMKCLEDGVGIHFYLPGIHGMRVYDTKNRQTLVVGDNCGAWIPQNQRLILKRISWDK